MKGGVGVNERGGPRGERRGEGRDVRCGEEVM